MNNRGATFEASILKKVLWFHRLQQRLSLTRNEAVTLIVLSALFSGGLLARHIQQQMNPIAPDAYAETDREFFERSASVLGDAGAVEPAASDSQETGSPANGRIDLNRATSDELQQLPRIGPKTAERIIDFRETYGPFGHVDDLAQVRGIGPKTMDQLRPLVHVAQDSLPR